MRRPLQGSVGEMETCSGFEPEDSSAGGEKWTDSRYIVKVELIGFLTGMQAVRKRGVKEHLQGS